MRRPGSALLWIGKYVTIDESETNIILCVFDSRSISNVCISYNSLSSPRTRLSNPDLETFARLLRTDAPTYRLDVSDELGIQVGEALELGLVQVHHEQFVGGRQIDLLGRELTVEVGHVFAVFLWARGNGTRDKVVGDCAAGLMNLRFSA